MFPEYISDMRNVSMIIEGEEYGENVRQEGRSCTGQQSEEDWGGNMGGSHLLMEEKEEYCIRIGMLL